MHSWARIGVPAATLSTTGTLPAGISGSTILGVTSRTGATFSAGCVKAMARPFPAPLFRTPSSSICFRWKCTVEGDFSPTASPISRTEGG